MIVNGIEWTHPQYATEYYGFNPATLVAKVDDIDLVAWIRTTPKYDTYWTVKATRGDERLFQVNFTGKETALAGAAIMVEAFGEDTAT